MWVSSRWRSSLSSAICRRVGCVSPSDAGAGRGPQRPQLGEVVLGEHAFRRMSSKRCRRNHCSCAHVQGVPPKYTIPCRRSSFDNRCRTHIKSARASSRARTRSRTASISRSGTVPAVISSGRSNLARCAASRASVLTRSPAGRCSFEGAATTHSIPLRESGTRGEPIRTPVSLAKLQTALGFLGVVRTFCTAIKRRGAEAGR
jgi:hypothetical protein